MSTKGYTAGLGPTTKPAWALAAGILQKKLNHNRHEEALCSLACNPDLHWRALNLCAPKPAASYTGRLQSLPPCSAG